MHRWGEGKKGGIFLAPSQGGGMGKLFLSLTWWGRECGKITAEHPCHPDKGLEKTQRNLPIFLGQTRKGWGGSPRCTPIHALMLCLSPQTVNIGVVTSLIKASVSLKNMESG